LLIPNEPEIARAAQKVVKKLWGTEFWIVNTKKYCLKFLKVNPSFQSSIHAHSKKDETFIGVVGCVRLDFHDPANNERTGGVVLSPGDSYNIAPKMYHSFQAINESWVMEVSTHHDDEDVTRLQESRKL
jgi:D-lyxose ketol-isomerase